MKNILAMLAVLLLCVSCTWLETPNEAGVTPLQKYGQATQEAVDGNWGSALAIVLGTSVAGIGALLGLGKYKKTQKQATELAEQLGKELGDKAKAKVDDLLKDVVGPVDEATD